MEAARYR